MTLQAGSLVKLNTSLATGISGDGHDETLKGVILSFKPGGTRQIVSVRWDRRIRYPQQDEYTMLHYLDTLIDDVHPDSLQGRIQSYVAKELG